MSQQKFVPQSLAWKTAVEKGGLQNGVGGDGSVDPRSEGGNAQALLEQGITAVVVCIGVGIEDGGQTPALGVKDLLNFPSRVLVISAVDEDSVGAVQFPDAHLGGALDVIGVLCGLNQFIHGGSFFLFVDLFTRRESLLPKACLQQDLTGIR